jgi:hypothetical protein
MNHNVPANHFIIDKHGVIAKSYRTEAISYCKRLLHFVRNKGSPRRFTPRDDTGIKFEGSDPIVIRIIRKIEMLSQGNSSFSLPERGGKMILDVK